MVLRVQETSSFNQGRAYRTLLPGMVKHRKIRIYSFAAFGLHSSDTFGPLARPTAWLPGDENARQANEAGNWDSS